MDWVSILINAILIIWIASLQIRASQSKTDCQNLDPVVQIQNASKKLTSTIKPYAIPLFFIGISGYSLYLEMQVDEPITKLVILKIATLVGLFFANIVLIIGTWHRAQGYKLATKIISDLTEAFSGSKSKENSEQET
ncbi:hypothetical protein BBN03_01665 [Vibrio parahaemolyticus]|uniref:hypothetical protein n=1 Tax=Vibrio parahaemolyticus TaxID=670 RepID=UPI00084B7373|nr:hypothetical protein [Vibrio parahaemolyticus]EJI6690918.1 hypothetical protein [Vibrio parahaemolyticus]OEA92685.1 hypothetical protein BBN03_01665 [Vibrio parahaemolyticus]